MATWVSARLIFKMMANGIRKNITIQAYGKAMTRCRPRGNQCLRAERLIIDPLYGQDHTGGRLPMQYYLIIPSWLPLTEAIDIGQGRNHLLTTRQTHMVDGDVAHVSDVFHHAGIVVEGVTGDLGAERDLLRAQSHRQVHPISNE